MTEELSYEARQKHRLAITELLIDLYRSEGSSRATIEALEYVVRDLARGSSEACSACGHDLQTHEVFGKEDRCIVVGCRCVEYTRKEVTT